MRFELFKVEGRDCRICSILILSKLKNTRLRGNPDTQQSSVLPTLNQVKYRT